MRSIQQSGVALIVTALILLACGNASGSRKPGSASGGDLGVDAASLSPVIDNPFVALALVKRAVYEGKELDDETGDTLRIRVVAIVRDTAETVTGMKVTVVEVSNFEDGKLTETTIDCYAQDSSGAVYCIGKRVNELEGGKVVGHEGQWVAGEKRTRAGVFMPARPKVGDEFDPERSPGVAESHSRVIGTGLAVTVPAGTCKDCIEAENSDPIKKSSQHRVYCRGMGLVRELAKTHSLELVELKLRSPASSPKPK